MQIAEPLRPWGESDGGAQAIKTVTSFPSGDETAGNRADGRELAEGCPFCRDEYNPKSAPVPSSPRSSPQPGAQA